MTRDIVNALRERYRETGPHVTLDSAGARADRVWLDRQRYHEVTTPLMAHAVVNERGQRMLLDTLQRRFRVARREAGIADGDFQFRDLRAKSGTDKTDSTGDIRQAQKQLGHTSVAMTEHYVRNRRCDKVKPTK